MTFGWPRIHIPVVSSTMPLLTDMARAGARHGTVLTCDFQTAGTGRHGRPWLAPAGTALLMSVLVRTQRPPQAWGPLSLLVASAVGRSLAGWGIEPVIKWPNDVLVDGRKISGILLRSHATPTGPALVIGLGLNVRHVSVPDPSRATSIEDELRHQEIVILSAANDPAQPMSPERTQPADTVASAVGHRGCDVAQPAVALAHRDPSQAQDDGKGCCHPEPLTVIPSEVEGSGSRDDVTPAATVGSGLPITVAMARDAVLHHLAEVVSRFESGDMTADLAWIRDRLAFRGEPVSMHEQGEPVSGILRDIRDDGALLIELADGSLHAVIAGELQRGPQLAREGR